MRNETEFDRGAWAFLGIIILVIFGQLGFALAGFQQPADGWNSRNNTAANQIHLYFHISDQPSPLQEDDIVLALNGQPLQVRGLYPKLGDVFVGQVVRYTIERDGEIIEVDVQLIQRSWRDILRFWQQTEPVGLLSSLLTLLVFGFAFFKRPGSTPARLLFLLGSALFGGSWFGFADYTFWNNYYPAYLFVGLVLLGSTWTWLFFPAFIHLTLIFPVRLPPIQRFPRLLPTAVYGIPALLSLPYVVTLLTKRDSSLLNIWAGTLFGMMALFILTFIYATLHNWRTPHDATVRAQLRWVALGFAGWIGTAILFALGGVSRDEAFRSLIIVISNLATLALPVCLAIAITRYRLFDIDVIIRKTLQYTLLSGLLGLVYFGCIVLLQNLFFGDQQSEIVIVLSTLLIAALFNPLRGRLQDVIDRRFYRKKYDAQQVLAQFAQTARDEVELDALTAELLHVIQETLQPEHLSVWLKPVSEKRHQE